MIELIIKQYLDSHLDVPSFLEKRSDMPTTYVLFEKTSGSQSNYLKNATFAFQSYAPSMYQAALLNEKLKDVVLKIDMLPEISGVSLNSDYNFTDEETKEYRYQAVFDINYY